MTPCLRKERAPHQFGTVIGGNLYSSEDHSNQAGRDKVESRRVWVYDPATRQAVQRADTPQFTAARVTGVIGDEL